MPAYERLSFPLPTLIVDSPSNYMDAAGRVFQNLRTGDYKNALAQIIMVQAPSLSNHVNEILDCLEYVNCRPYARGEPKIEIQKQKISDFCENYFRDIDSSAEVNAKRESEVSDSLTHAISLLHHCRKTLGTSEVIKDVSHILFLNNLIERLGIRNDISMKDLLSRDLRKVEDDIRVWSEITNLDAEKLFLEAPQIHRKVFTPEVTIIPDFEPSACVWEKTETSLKDRGRFEFPAQYEFGGLRSNFGLIYNSKQDDNGKPWRLIDSIVTLDPEVMAQINASDPSLLEDLAHLFRATAHDHVHTCVFHPQVESSMGVEKDAIVTDGHLKWFNNMSSKMNMYAMEYEHHAAVTKLSIWDEQIKKNPKQKQELLNMSVQYLGKVKNFLETEHDPQRRSQLAEYLVCVGTYPLFGVLDPNGTDLEPVKQAISAIKMPEQEVSLEPLIRTFGRLFNEIKTADTYAEQVELLKRYFKYASGAILGAKELKQSLDELGLLDETMKSAPKLSGYNLVRFKILEASMGAYEDTHKRRTVFDGNEQVEHSHATRAYASTLGRDFFRH